MTIEEKAKAYDEALEKAREILCNINEYSDSCRDIETIFPELAKSEDERIRKELVLFLSDIKSISESGRTTWAVRKEDAMLCKTALAWLEKQKEQKPAWSEEDERIRRNLMSLLSVMRGDRIREETYQKYYPWLKNLPERFNLQPKQEWSEEDRTMVFTLMRDIEQVSFISKEGKNKRIAWLNNLPNNIKPQPQYKPSEEQMEALKDAIADVARFSKRGGRQVELENEPYYSALHSLYEQLKKLM